MSFQGKAIKVPFSVRLLTVFIGILVKFQPVRPLTGKALMLILILIKHKKS
jgi:hypothetical protein